MSCLDSRTLRTFLLERTEALCNSTHSMPYLIITIFFTSMLFGFHTEASFKDEQVTPTLNRASDRTSAYLWASGLASLLLVRPLDSQIKNGWGQHTVLPAEQSNIGDRYTSFGLNIAFALSQLWWDQENGISHIRGLIYTTGITHALKVTTQLRRPDDSDPFSFPSGHTSASFSTATSLTYAYGWKAAIPAYGLAALSGLSRIADDKHWASDVVAGAFLGIIWGRASFYNNAAPTNETSHPTQAFYPSYENGQLSLVWNRHF